MANLFKRSSYCVISACVEVAQKKNGISVRRATNRKKVLNFSKKEWRDFLKGVKGGEFDV